MEKELQKIFLILRNNLPEIKEKYSVSTIELFGSFVHNSQNNESDLDILVSFSKAPSLFKYLQLEEYLSELLDVKVDLVMKSSLKPNIGKRILAEAKPVYEQ